MFRQPTLGIVVVIALPLLFLASAGMSYAHDTGIPHTPDGEVNDFSVFNSADPLRMLGVHSHPGHGVPTGSAPMAFLIVPIGGDFFPFHWLWHTMNGETLDDRMHLVHELTHWYDIPHPHSESLVEEGGDQSATIEQVE